MELKIKKKWAVIISYILWKPILWVLLLTATGFVIMIIFIPSSPTNLQSVLYTSLIFVFPALYLSFKIIDAYLYASTAIIKINEKQIDMQYKNIRASGNQSIPVAQVQAICVHQDFIRKIFRICVILFEKKSGIITSAYGFNIEEAEEFARFFSKRYHIPVKSQNKN